MRISVGPPKRRRRKPPGENSTLPRAIAVNLNAEGIEGGPFGVLVKTTGNNCLGYSCDIICSGQGDEQRQWDVFVASEETADPVWREVLGGIAIRPCEIQ